MRRPGIAEWVLKRATSADRATAIYGDLTELAATRGAAWFWFAYARTLVAFLWRTPVAILAGVISVRYLRGVALGRLIALIWGASIIHLNDPRLHAWQVPYLNRFSWMVSWYAVLFLWVVLPYVAIRFGLRNRLSYLAGALFLLAAPMYTLRPQIYQVTGLACALVVVAALASPAWRRQMIFLLANCAVAYLVFYFSITHAPGIFRHGPFPVSLFHMRIDGPLSIAAMVLIGPPLHRWLLEKRNPSAPVQLAGVAHA